MTSLRFCRQLSKSAWMNALILGLLSGIVVIRVVANRLVIDSSPLFGSILYEIQSRSLNVS